MTSHPEDRPSDTQGDANAELLAPADGARRPRRSRRRGSRRADRKAARTATRSEGSAALVTPAARADRFSAQDLLVEATADIGSRPGRLAMTLVGTVLGIGALVATIGFAQTAGHQIARQFDAARSTQVVAVAAESETASGTVTTGRLPWDAPERLNRLVGVDAAAIITDVPIGEDRVAAVSVNDPSAPAVAPPPIVASSAHLLDVTGASLVTGRMFDEGHDARGDRVVVLGAGAAERLGINRVDTQPSIFIGDAPYAVLGIFDGLTARGDLRNAVVMPTQTARADRGITAPGEVQARIEVGTGPQVGEQAAIALAPDEPDSIDVTAPSARSNLSQNVQSDVNVIFLILGGIVLLAGALGIANVTMLNVMERIPEIGLRRALGATRRQIAAQFVVESLIVGLLGGLLGAAIAVLAVVGFALSQQWTPIVNGWVALAGVALGALVGLIAGGFPARRASRIEPVAALSGR